MPHRLLVEQRSLMPAILLSALWCSDLAAHFIYSVYISREQPTKAAGFPSPFHSGCQNTGTLTATFCNFHQLTSALSLRLHTLPNVITLQGV